MTKRMADFKTILESLNPSPRSALRRVITHTIERWVEVPSSFVMAGLKSIAIGSNSYSET
ncbi:MAG: hypothetical protein HRU19_27325 [Pseudobacteriovorax sp.]|nr:hypothetical protein [Pseudobacteriovorax sp.]